MSLVSMDDGIKTAGSSIVGTAAIPAVTVGGAVMSRYQLVALAIFVENSVCFVPAKSHVALMTSEMTV